MSTSDLAYLIAGIALILILFAFELGSAFGAKREKQYWLEGQRDMLHTMMSIDEAEMNAKEQILREVIRCNSRRMPVSPSDLPSTPCGPRRRTKETDEAH